MFTLNLMTMVQLPMLEFLVVELWVSKQYGISSSSIFCKDVRTLTRPYIFFSQPLPLRTWPRRGSNRSVVLRSALRGYLHLPGRCGTLCPGCFWFPLSKSTTRDQWRVFGKGRSSIIPKKGYKNQWICAPRWTQMNSTDQSDQSRRHVLVVSGTQADHVLHGIPT